MEGAAIRERNAFNVALVTSWHTARFALNGYADKGRLAGQKTLSDILLTDKSGEPEPEKLRNAKLIAGFQSLKARGFDVQITRHPVN